MYMLPTIDPPKQVLSNIEKAFANFLWGAKKGFQKRHWMS